MTQQLIDAQNRFDPEEARRNDLAQQRSSGSSLVFGNPDLPAAKPSSIENALTGGFNPQSVANIKPLVDKYFNPGYDATKALWTTFWESGGRNESALDPGSDGATGYFRIQNIEGRPSPQELLDPENNVRYASWLAYGSQGDWRNWNGPNATQKASFKPWGDEGVTYLNPNTGKQEPFGALSKHPFPTDAPNLPATPLPTDYPDAVSKAQEDAKYSLVQTEITARALENYRATVGPASQDELNAINARHPTSQDAIYTRMRQSGGDTASIRMDILKERDAEVEALNQKNREEEAKLIAAANLAANNSQKAQQWASLLQSLPNLIADSNNDIRSVDDLEKVIDSQARDATTGWNPLKQEGNANKLTDWTPEQRDYLSNVISHLSPYVNHPSQEPASQKQLSEFLAASNSSAVLPSKRVSIASLSADNIKSILTTLPGQTGLPSGLSLDDLRKYYSSRNLLSPEDQKALDSVKGTTSKIVQDWINTDARYQAYKLGLADPTNALKDLKLRENNILQWTLDKLEVYQSNVVRPIAAYGLSAIGSLYDIPVIGPGIRQQLTAPGEYLANLIGIHANTDDLRKQIRENRQNGQNWWEAAGNGFQQWDANVLVKMLAETVADPTTYIGFGIYPKIVGKVPILGTAVRSLEEGWKLAWDNPIISRAAELGTGAAIGYTVTGGDTRGALAGAGVASLRLVSFRTPAQFIERAMKSPGGLVSLQNEALLTSANRTTLEAITADEIRAAADTGIKSIVTNPSTAHLIPQGNWIKGILGAIRPWIDESTIGTWLSKAADEITARTEAGVGTKAATEVPAFSAATKPTQSQLIAANRVIDMTLGSSSRGIISIDEAAEKVAKIFELPKSSVPSLRDSIITHFQNNYEALTTLLAGDNAGTIYKNLLDASERGLRASFTHGLEKYGNFEGFVLGLGRKVDPVTKTAGYKLLAGIQNYYARSMLWFFNFKPMNLLETWARAGLGGGGWGLPITSDEIYAARNYFGWNNAFPQSLREGGRGNLEIVPVTSGKSSVAAVKRRGWMGTLADWVSMSGVKRVENNVEAAAYQHFIPDEFARAMPELFSNIRSQLQSIQQDLVHGGITYDEASSRVTELLNHSLRPDAPQVIRNLKTDMVSATQQKAIRDVYTAAQKYVHLDQPIVEGIVRELQRGNWDSIDKIFADHTDLLYDMTIAKAEGGITQLKDISQRFQEVIHDEGVDTQQVTDMVRFLADAREVISDATSELRSSATTRGHSILGEANTSEHWDIANNALHSYTQTAGTEFQKMIDSIRTRVNELFAPEEAVKINSILSNMENRTNLLLDTRNKDVAVIEDFTKTHGRRPQSKEEWDSVNRAREQIWEDYRRRDGLALINHNRMAEDFSHTSGVINDVTHSGLTTRDIATMITSSGDELAQSLVQHESLMPKDVFTNAIYGTAEAKANLLGKTPEELGWTKDAIGRVYDDLRIRMNTNPTEDSTLYVTRNELESLRKDTHTIAISRGYNPDQLDLINDAYEKFAKYMEANPLPREKIDTVFERANLRYKTTFTDYTDENVFDAIMRGIFPFWFYQRSRWPYLAKTALTHPGLMSTWSRYQNYTENGYTHIPGQDMAFNVARGTILMGGLGGLIRQFPARYEDGPLGTLGHAVDNISQAGFFPGIYATLPLSLAGINDFSLPPAVDSALNLGTYFIDPNIASLRQRLFPDRYRTFYTAEIASKIAQNRDFDFSGDDIRRHLESGKAIDEEKAIWKEAEKEVAGYQLLFDQTGILKLDIQEKRDAAKEAAAFIASKTGVSIEDQDAITNRLGDSGYRLSDLFPLDPMSAKQLYETSKYKYWSGISNVLQPEQFRRIQDRTSSYWEQVNNIYTQANTTGLTSRDGKRTFESLQSLDEQFRSGKLNPRDYLKKVADTKAEATAETEGLKKEYNDIPITLAERASYNQEHDIQLPVDHPAKELLNYYHQIELTTDPTTGEPNWDRYFASIDTLLTTLPDDKRQYLLDYIQKEWTPSQKLYWQVNNQYLRSYMNLRTGILEALVPEQQQLIKQYQNASAATIDNLPEDTKKIITDFNSAVSRARQKYRMLDPETDAWLYYWGKSTSLETESARLKYNSLIKKYGGGSTVDNPIDESKKKILAPLP